jgi:hypothetical protein
LWREVTRLNSERQFKAFIYLNAGRPERHTFLKAAGPALGARTRFTHYLKKKSRLPAGLSCSRSYRCDLTIFIGILALTAWILLLLAGLLTAALLLAGLLTGVLVLLPRILVLAGHQDLLC